MADRRIYYLDQQVTSAELNAGFQTLEQADRNLASDLGFFGVIAGAVVVQHAALANLTVDVSGAGIIYDQTGERIFWPNVQNVDVSKDFNQVSTAVSTTGNEKWVSLFAQFSRTLSDPRVDGNSNTVYFVQNEAFAFYVTQGAEAPIGTAPLPSMQSAMVLLADINMRFGETQVLNGSISISRRQDWAVINGSPLSIRRGRIADAFADVVAAYNNLLGGTQTLPATSISYAGTSAWADGTTNPATTVEGMLDHIVAELAGSTGSAKVQAPAHSGSQGYFNVAAGTLDSQVSAMVTAIDEIKGGFKLVDRKRIAPASVASPSVTPGSLASWSDGAYNSAHTYGFTAFSGLNWQINDWVFIYANLQFAYNGSDTYYGKLQWTATGVWGGGAVTDFSEGDQSFQHGTTGASDRVFLEQLQQLTNIVVGGVVTGFQVFFSGASSASTTFSLRNNSTITCEVWRPTP